MASYTLVGSKFFYDSYGSDMRGLGISPDEGYLFIAVPRSSNKIHRQTLPVPGDITTMTSRSSFISTGNSYVIDIFVPADGSVMFTISYAGTTYGKLTKYSMPTPFNMGMTLVNNYSPNAILGTEPSSMQFNSTLTKFFATKFNGYSVYEFALATPGDLSTVSFTGSIDLTTVAGAGAVDFSASQIRIFNGGLFVLAAGKLHRFSLVNSNSILALTDYTEEFDFNPAMDFNAQGFCFNANGTKMYVSGYDYVLDDYHIRQYSVVHEQPVSIFWTNFHGLREEA